MTRLGGHTEKIPDSSFFRCAVTGANDHLPQCAHEDGAAVCLPWARRGESSVGDITLALPCLRWYVD